MFATRLFLYQCVLLLPLLVNASQTCPNGVFAIIASQLAKYAPAVSYCSSRYPLSTMTMTVLAPTSTISATPITITQTTTDGTTLLTTTVPTITSVTTQYVMVTVVESTGTATTTSTLAVQRLKKRATTAATKTTSTPDARASIFSSLLSGAKAVVSTACLCIEGPAPTITSTFTPKTTVSSTATVTQDVIITNMATVTPSTLVTSIVTSTTTTTTTTTAVSLPTTCSAQQANKCADFCNIGYPSGGVVFNDAQICINQKSVTCSTDNDCAGLSQGTLVCVFADANFDCPGGRVCAEVDTTCGSGS